MDPASRRRDAGRVGPPPATAAGEPAPASPLLADVLGYQLAMARVTTSAVFRQAVGDPLQLRPVEYTILALIHEQPGMAPARLAGALAVTAPNITAWLIRLEARGLVVRSPSDTDRRVQLLRLTAEGDRLCRESTRRLVEGERSRLSALSQGEYTLLSELLRKVAAARALP